MDLRVSLRRLAAACCFGVGAMLTFVGPAAAQDCPALEAPPALADGATATVDDMRAADTRYRTWGAAREAALTCYRNTVAPAIETNIARRQAHDAAAVYLNAISAAWRAQADIFNAREGGPVEATVVEMPAAPPAGDTACPALQAADQIPSGAASTREQVDAYNQLYTAWGTAFRAGLECRAQEIISGEARAQPLVQTYNSGNTELGEVNAAWAAEIAEFEARTPDRRRAEDNQYGDQ